MIESCDNCKYSRITKEKIEGGYKVVYKCLLPPEIAEKCFFYKENFFECRI